MARTYCLSFVSYSRMPEMLWSPGLFVVVSQEFSCHKSRNRHGSYSSFRIETAICTFLLLSWRPFKNPLVSLFGKSKTHQITTCGRLHQHCECMYFEKISFRFGSSETALKENWDAYRGKPCHKREKKL